MALESLTGWLLRCRPSQFMSVLLYLATVAMLIAISRRGSQYYWNASERHEHWPLSATN
jgi:hypothetical protein